MSYSEIEQAIKAAGGRVVPLVSHGIHDGLLNGPVSAKRGNLTDFPDGASFQKFIGLIRYTNKNMRVSYTPAQTDGGISVYFEVPTFCATTK